VQALVTHCEQWVTKFLLLLHDIATSELQQLYEYFTSNTAKLKATPRDLDELAISVQLQKQLDADRRSVEARLQPLQSMFATLEKVRMYCHHLRHVAVSATL
jgi:dynein heavy chain, axonemal